MRIEFLQCFEYVEDLFEFLSVNTRPEETLSLAGTKVSSSRLRTDRKPLEKIRYGTFSSDVLLFISD